MTTPCRPPRSSFSGPPGWTSLAELKVDQHGRALTDRLPRAEHGRNLGRGEGVGREFLTGTEFDIYGVPMRLTTMFVAAAGATLLCLPWSLALDTVPQVLAAQATTVGSAETSDGGRILFFSNKCDDAVPVGTPETSCIVLSHECPNYPQKMCTVSGSTCSCET